MKTSAKGTGFVLAAAIVWSSGGVLVKLLDWDAMSIVCVRSLIAAVVLTLYIRFSEPCSLREFFRRFMNFPTLSCGLAIAVTSFCFINATKLTTAANAIVIQNTSPVFVVILGFVFLRKKPGKHEIITMVFVFAGIGLFFGSSFGTGGMSGNLLALTGGIAYACMFFVNKLPGARTAHGMLLGQVFGAIASFPFLVLHPIGGSGIAWLYITLLGVVQIGIGYALFSEGAKHCDSLKTSLLCMIEPILNPIWVAIATGEKPGLLALTGAVVVIGTMAWYAVISAKQPHPKYKRL